uniref:Protein CNPPD1 n=1 Tax=Elaeophora elaphi TaxID=1147741 RepID=A0A0R3S0D0_9BILA
MSPVSLSFKRLQQRLRRSLCYGSRQMKSLPLPLSELAIDYFDRHCPYDYMSMDSATSISRHGYVDACTFLVAMVYLDRIRTADNLYFESSNPGELYLSALIIASKYLHDVGQREFVYNDEWAALASISLKRVNEVELSVLDAIHWSTNVNYGQFIRILEEVETWIAEDSLEKRGFCTYNEIAVLLSKIDLISDCVKPLMLSLAALTFVYSAAVVSLLMFPQIAISASIQRNLAKNDAYMLSITSTVDKTTQQGKAAFSPLHENFYKWYTSHNQRVFRTLIMSNVAIKDNMLFNRTAFWRDALSLYNLYINTNLAQYFDDFL